MRTWKLGSKEILIVAFMLSNVGYSWSRSVKDTVVNGGDTLICRKNYSKENVPISEACQKGGKYHGLFRSWHDNGRLASSGEYANGMLVDTFRTYFPNGSLKGISPPEGKHFTLASDGDTLTIGWVAGGKQVGLLRRYYSADRPKRFTNFNDNGDKHGWEIFWYDNGNAKDSILFRNDSTMQRRSYYYNGKPQMFEDDIYGTYDAVSFNPKGKRTGRIKDGTGAVFLCDSVGGDCKELKYKDGKRIIE